MDRINKIINHPLYKEYYNQIQAFEETRVFCGHDNNHFMAVARISYIMYLEDCLAEGKAIIFKDCSDPKESIYALGLLHDIGRHIQYATEEPHELASKRLCKTILEDCGFIDLEIKAFQEAIGNHRNPLIKNDQTLSGYLYKGDKASRPCHSCPVEKDCHRLDEKKNLKLYI